MRKGPPPSIQYFYTISKILKTGEVSTYIIIVIIHRGLCHNNYLYQCCLYNLPKNLMVPFLIAGQNPVKNMKIILMLVNLVVESSMVLLTALVL